MKKKKDSLFLVIVTLIISLIGLCIAYATFSQTLRINGSASVTASNWDIHFSSTEGGSGGGTITPTLSNINGSQPTSTASVGTFNSTQLTWTGSVKSPGDRIEFAFYIVNNGDYNAKISSLSKSALTCKSNNVVETTICNKLSYTFKYSDGTEVKSGDSINAKESKAVVLTLLLGDFESSETPSSNVIVDEDTLTITILYEQDGSVVTGN